jgi:hypothetical protein
MEDYPDPGDWSYMDFFMFIHQRIYDEAIKLKKAAIVAEHSGGALRRDALRYGGQTCVDASRIDFIG